MGKYREITDSVVREVTSVCIFPSKHKESFMSHGDKNNFLISKAGNDHRHQPWRSSTPKHLSPRCRRMTSILASTAVDSLVVKSQCGKIQPRFRFPPPTHTHTQADWCNACLRATGWHVFFSCNLWRPHRGHSTGSFVDANRGSCWWPGALEGRKVQFVKRFLTRVENSHKPNQETIWGFNRLSGRSRGALRCLSAWLNPDGMVTAVVWFELAWLYHNPQAALRRKARDRPTAGQPQTKDFQHLQ